MKGGSSELSSGGRGNTGERLSTKGCVQAERLGSPNVAALQKIEETYLLPVTGLRFFLSRPPTAKTKATSRVFTLKNAMRQERKPFSQTVPFTFQLGGLVDKRKWRVFLGILFSTFLFLFFFNIYAACLSTMLAISPELLSGCATHLGHDFQSSHNDPQSQAEVQSVLTDGREELSYNNEHTVRHFALV